jgi:dolichol kinase
LLCHSPGFTDILLKEIACKEEVIRAKSVNVKLIFIVLCHRDTLLLDFILISVLIIIWLIRILYPLKENVRVPS